MNTNMGVVPVTLTLDMDDGMFIGTVNANDVLTLAPQSLATTYPLDTSAWQQSGAGWTEVGDDKVEIDNTDSGNYFLVLIYEVDQDGQVPPVANKVTFRLTVTGEGIAALSNGFSIELILTDSDGLGGVILGDEQVQFAAGDSLETQYTIEKTPSAPAHYLYAYIFTRSQIGKATFWNAEVFQNGDTQRTYGQWFSKIYDLAEEVNLPITQGAIDLTKVLYYYSNLSNVDNFDNAEHCIEVLSEFSILVCNEPGLNTTTRQQYVQQALIDAGVDLFGYANVGVSESSLNGCHPQNNITEAVMDRCAAAGYAGIFFDAWGMPESPMEQMNALVDYAHGLGLIVIGNGHPQGNLNTDVTTDVTPAPTTAPTLTATGESSLAAGEYKVCWTRTSYVGETTASPITPITITANQGIEVSDMSGGFDNCYGINIYMSDAAGSSTLRLKSEGTYGDDIILTSLPDIEAVTPPAVNDAYIGNSLGISSTLNSTDWLCWESFYSRSDDEYDGADDFAAKFANYAADMQLAKTAGVKVMALVYALSSIPITDYSDMEAAYILTAGLELEGFCYTGQSLSVNTVDWPSSSFTVPKTGTSLTTPLTLKGTGVYEAETDEGIVQFITTDDPVSRTYKTFRIPTKFLVSLASLPEIDAETYELLFYTSPDGVIWTEAETSNETLTTSNRYVRFKIILQNSSEEA